MPINIKLDDILNDIYLFLKDHPSEFVYVSIKAEGDTTKWVNDEFDLETVHCTSSTPMVFTRQDSDSWRGAWQGYFVSSIWNNR